MCSRQWKEFPVIRLVPDVAIWNCIFSYINGYIIDVHRGAENL